MEKGNNKTSAASFLLSFGEGEGGEGHLTKNTFSAQNRAQAAASTYALGSLCNAAGDDVYQAYSTTWRGLEFVMTYYPILDRAPKGRDEGDAFQVWIRRHDEYNGS